MAAQTKILIYTTKKNDLPRGYAYANPRWFSTPRSDVAKVIVDGDYPNIVAAYKKIGVPVAHAGMTAEEADTALGGLDTLPGGETQTPAQTTTPAEKDPPAPPASEPAQTATPTAPAAPAQPTAPAPAAEPQHVDIPANYEALPWKDMRTLAMHFTKEQVVNKAQALKVIANEIAHRAAAAAKK